MRCVHVCVYSGGPFPEARGVYMAAALDVICHRCYPSPPAAFLAMNCACSRAPENCQNDSVSIRLQVHLSA